MAYRPFFVLAVAAAIVGIALFVLHSFAYPVALFVAAVFAFVAVFALGALVARPLPRPL